jgi:hypothetical protein
MPSGRSSLQAVCKAWGGAGGGGWSPAVQSHMWDSGLVGFEWRTRQECAGGVLASRITGAGSSTRMGPRQSLAGAPCICAKTIQLLAIAQGASLAGREAGLPALEQQHCFSQVHLHLSSEHAGSARLRLLVAAERPKLLLLLVAADLHPQMSPAAASRCTTCSTSRRRGGLVAQGSSART